MIKKCVKNGVRAPTLYASLAQSGRMLDENAYYRNLAILYGEKFFCL